MPAQVRARIAVTPTEMGGRKTPIMSGYRPQLHLEGDISDWIMTITDMEPDPLNPGESGEIDFHLKCWEEVRSRLQVGTEFMIREGYRVVATGVVTAVEVQR